MVNEHENVFPNDELDLETTVVQDAQQLIIGKYVFVFVDQYLDHASGKRSLDPATSHIHPSNFDGRKGLLLFRLSHFHFEAADRVQF